MFVFVASVKDTLDPFADMLKLVVFSEYIPELVFAVNEIDGAATVPFPARNVPIVSVDAAVRLSCFRYSAYLGRSVRWNSPVC
jgi:hypothetical protein